MDAIEIEGLRKVYRQRVRGGETIAVDRLDLNVPVGGVFGFLGPNGSGKTTTIRCLLGLVRPSGGACRVLGSDVPSGLSGVIGRIGSMVETPTHFNGFTGRRNLELLATIGGLPRSAVTSALDRVGLGPRADERVKGYSLGMKQRLGLAAVLMKDPELLVLDEPANGLDPAGLKEIRDLLRSLADEGRTVFLSSHLLGEVQAICDTVAILSKGRCIATGPVDDVLHGGRGHAFVVRAPNLRRARKVLADAGFAVTVGEDRTIVVAAVERDAGRITRTLAEAGIFLTELRPEQVSLESVFLDLTTEVEE